LRKKKKIKAIKSQNRLKLQDSEIAQTQQSWQKFVTKVGKAMKYFFVVARVAPNL